METSDLKNIWSVPLDLTDIQPDLTPEIIRNAESIIGNKLPRELVQILEIQNGGKIRYTLPNKLHGSIYGIGPNLPSLLNFEWLFEGLDKKENNLFPFDSPDGHGALCLDYRNVKMQPRVVYVEPSNGYDEIISDSFSDYLDLLVIDLPFQYVIETNEEFYDIINAISRMLGVNFNEIKSHEIGYQRYDATFNGCFFSISSNKAPKEFVARSHNRYEELSTKFSEIAIRYPEIPEDSMLLKLTNCKEKESLLQILSNRGMKIYSSNKYFNKTIR